jgi:hypothetical protein
MDELTQIETVGTTDGTRESIVILSTSYFWDNTSTFSILMGKQ